MSGHKCSDFSIDNLLKSETSSKKRLRFSQSHEYIYQCPTSQEVTLQNVVGHSKKLKYTKNDTNIHIKVGQPDPSFPILSQEKEFDPNGIESQTLSWLTCTRFNPPKVTRSRKREGSVQERRTGRGPRIPFSPGQIAVLESTFTNSRYLSSDSISRLANALDLSNDRVKIWFQNRRARFKRERAAIDVGSRQGQLSPSQTNINPGHTHHHWKPLHSQLPQTQQYSTIFIGGSSFFPQLCNRTMNA